MESRPSEIPSRDVSPGGLRDSQSRVVSISDAENNNNNAASDAVVSVAAGDQPASSYSIPLNDALNPDDRASHANSFISESVLRQWGVSSSSNDASDFGRGGWSSNSNGFDLGMDSLRIDRSASFDDDPRAYAPPLETEGGATHRRIASTGGNRYEIDLTQVFEGGDVPEGDGEMILNDGLSALHDAARITDWPSVMALSQSNPEAAKYVGPDGWNALHHACDRRCPHVDVIDSLLSAYPEALVQTNDKGWTPLHRACRNKTPRDVVRLLLRKYPELGKRAASMRCNDGRSSLHYALLYDAPEGVMELLLQADPGAVLDEDISGLSPLGTVWDKYADGYEGKRTLQILLRPFEGEGWELGGNNERDEGVRVEAEMKVREAMTKSAAPACKMLQEKWQKANTLLRVYFHFPPQGDNSSDKGRKWRVLHATSAIKCHPTLFRLARALHPEEALEIDVNDLLGGSRDANSLPDPQTGKMANRTALHFAAMSPLSGRDSRNVVKVLIKLNPNAARHVDGSGSLPLHSICQNDRKLHWSDDGARDISNAYPGAASVRDSNGRTPLHCAASSAKHCTHSASTLPRAPTPTDPSVIENLVFVNRTAASMADCTGRLPLHYVAEHGEEFNIEAQSILNAHPAAVRTRAGTTTSNRLPLHMAAFSPDARPSLIMNLVDANPRAASIVDGSGRLPLHLAVDSGRTTWDRGIDSIYLAFNPAISAPEESPRRWTVLHTAAASHYAGRELIEHIISLNENAASVADGEGKHPLHLACAANRPWEDGGVKAIFNADPSVALSEDKNGMLPFHVAAMKGSGSTTSTTRNAFADSEGDIVTTDADERLSGEDVTNDLESLEVLFNLLSAQPSVVQM